MVSANREMVVYCFDTLVAHYNNGQAPPPAFDAGQQYVLPFHHCAVSHVYFSHLFGSIVQLHGAIYSCCFEKPVVFTSFKYVIK